MPRPPARAWIPLVAATAAVGLAHVAGASTSPAEVSAPAGDSTTVSALAALPPLAEASPRVLFGIERAGAAVGGDLNEARASLRLLRRRLGASGIEAVYAFRIGETICMSWAPRGVACSTSTSTPLPGATLAFSPGGPGYRGLSSDASPALAGVVTDDVRSVVLTSNGARRPLAIVNNAVFGEVEQPPAHVDWVLDLEVAYATGHLRRMRIPDPRHGR
jgi:hypothetical protein